MAAAGFGDSVEGLHAVAAALEAGRVTKLFFERGRGDELAEQAQAAGISVSVSDDVRPLARTTAPQGVVARCTPIRFTALDDLVAEATPAALVMVDHVEDPHNVGAIARSAVAAGVPRLVVPGRRAAPLGAAAFKAAAGALERCRVAQVSSIADAVGQCKRLDVWTIGLDASGDDSLFNHPLLNQPVAVVVGGETGLHRLVRDRVDVVASIPMASGTESLNASVAAALACFEILRSRS
ncbi:MAG: RNA methyltransferase [Acidimicrobiia bacterium]|nr:RNA methyltransferase [Acidimicrobiia bacterium]MDH4306276.1 RNA methyltransferase [Acidimicrobiia bacterium]MDH5292264.1 RNA methyltransferase [Acidimicrobiia bacterium]